MSADKPPQNPLQPHKGIALATDQPAESPAQKHYAQAKMASSQPDIQPMLDDEPPVSRAKKPAKRPLSKDAYAFHPLLAEIQEKPSPPLSHWTFWLILALLATALAWSFIGTMAVVVTARGKLIPAGQVKVLQAADGGVIRQILVKDGQHVKRGDLLLDIDPSGTDPELNALKTSLRMAAEEANRLRATVRQQPYQANTGDVDIDSEEQALHQSALASLRNQLAAKQDEMARLEAEDAGLAVSIKNLQAQVIADQAHMARLIPVRDILPRDDVDKLEKDLIQQQHQLKELQFQRLQNMHQKRAVKHTMGYLTRDFHQTHLRQLTDTHKQINTLKAREKEVDYKRTRQQLRAPVNGTVDGLQVFTEGAVVTPAQKLLSLIPDNTPLQAQLLVENKDIGSVKPGDSVDLKLDAYEFQKFGVVPGKVVHVGANSRELSNPTGGQNGQPPQQAPTGFEVWVASGSTFPAPHQGIILKPGYAVTGDIIVGHRRMIDFLLYPMLKHWQEGVQVR